MPAPTTIEAFLELGVRSGLLDPAQSYGAPTSTLDDYVAQTRRIRPMTRFQAEKLMHGRWRGFVIAGKYRCSNASAPAHGSGLSLRTFDDGPPRCPKVLPLAQAADPASLKRFYREARAVARLDHPHIIRAHDLDHEDNLHFLVLEFIDGCNLHDFVRRNGPISPLRTAHYLRQAALGLAHAHESGLVHRDIKPSNMLLDRGGCVKLLDMGLAQFFDEGNSAFVKEFENGFVIAPRTIWRRASRR